MISVITNHLDYVVAYIEWEVVDKDGQFKNNGEYIYIQNCWINDSHRFGQNLYILAQKIAEHPYSKKSTKVYWDVAKDSNNRKVLESEQEDENGNVRQRIYGKDHILNKLRSRYDYIKDFVSMQIQ